MKCSSSESLPGAGGGVAQAAAQPQGLANLRDEAAVCTSLGRLLGPDRELCDFTFIVGEQRERLPAVKAVVAVRSPPLKQMLFGDFRDARLASEKGELEMPQWSPAAFRHMLEFLHAGATDVEPAAVLELMQLADYLQVDELKAHCKAFLAENLSVENVATLLVEAVRLNDDQLRAKCKEFFLANARTALQSPNLRDLTESLLCELLGDNALNVDEWGVYQAVRRWSTDQPQVRQRRQLGCEADDGAATSAAGEAEASTASESSALALASGPFRCVRLGQLSVEQLRLVRSDGLIGEGLLLDAALNKLEGREVPDTRRRTVCFAFRFDGLSKGEGVSLSEDRSTATFGKDNCVLGDQLVPDCNQVYWEVIVNSGTNAYVGIARKERIDLQRNMGSGGGIAFRGIGGNEKWKECSHFEYGRRICKGDRVGVLVDLPNRSIAFYMNGEPLGIAFDNLDPGKRYLPCVSNNGGQMALVPSPRLPP